MEWRALGDCAWIHIAPDAPADSAFASMLTLRDGLESSRIPEVQDVVAASGSVAVHFDVEHGILVHDWLRRLPFRTGPAQAGTGPVFRIPVDYQDPCSELESIARRLGMPADEVVRRHAAPLYQVSAVGFSPGFPYLSGLDPALSLPRKPTPALVPAGAVAVSAHHAGIYPNASPGGWHLLGRTDLSLFDPLRDRPALLSTGASVTFYAAEIRKESSARAFRFPDSGRDIEVLDAGPFTTIQDAGRPGYRAAGVTSGGALDPVSLRVVNALVGNPSSAAVLECAGSGPVLRMRRDLTIAHLGWFKGSGAPFRLRAGEVLDLRQRMSFACGLIALEGGLDAPFLLGSRGTDVRSGFGGWGGRCLRVGDVLAVRPAGLREPSPGDWQVAWPRGGSDLELRYLEGLQADWFGLKAHRILQKEVYQIGSRGNRTATRLNGPLLHAEFPREMLSQPVVPGSIQVPPDGVPTVLLAECQTLGGYPQIGHVISADLPALARALPGTKVRFRKVDLDEARAAWRNLRHQWSRLEIRLRHFS